MYPTYRYNTFCLSTHLSVILSLFPYLIIANNTAVIMAGSQSTKIDQCIDKVLYERTLNTCEVKNVSKCHNLYYSTCMKSTHQTYLSEDKIH